MPPKCNFKEKVSELCHYVNPRIRMDNEVQPHEGSWPEVSDRVGRFCAMTLRVCSFCNLAYWRARS
jgi:hypothetical protein